MKTYSNSVLSKKQTKIKSKQKLLQVPYVVQEKRHENTDIYKIGRTENLYSRLKGYPGGKLIHAMSVCTDDLETKEKLLKQLLYKRLKKRREGYEYFEGDRKVFLQAFSELEE